MRASLAPLAALVAALVAAAPAAAQPFRSDDTGPIITGSGVAGGAFPGAAFRGLEDALFRRAAGGTAFRTRAIADAVLGAAAGQGRAACSGSLEPPRHWPRGVPLDTAAQRAVCGLLERPDAPERAAILRALTGGLAGPHVERAEALVDALAGVLRRDFRYLDERQRWVDGAAWERAFRAYEAYLSAAPAALLDPPPAELVVVGTILQRVVDAGLDASRR
jgi:hypothetical protein